MAIDKPSLNDFLPNGFETQDKTGWKQNFDSDKISTGFDKDTLEVLSGPNLNNLLDNVGKNTHTLQQFLNFFRDMPIGSFPVVNTSNQLDYKSVNSFFRNVGEIVFSAIPLEDGNLRLLDGSLLEYTMTYSRFISYIAGYRTSLPNLFCTEQEFNQSVATYGVCGKFVYDTVTKSLRLPKISGFIKGTLDSGSLGDVDEAKAPNITGTIAGLSYDQNDSKNGMDGAFYWANVKVNGAGSGSDDRYGKFDASRSSSVYKNGATTIEPQAVKEFIYMVVSIDEAEKQVLSAVYNYKGSVPTYADLPTAVAIGEVYNVIGEDPEGYSGANFAWTGEEWDRLGGTVNLSGYLTKTEAGNTYATKASLESNVDYLQGQINTNASNIANIASQEVIDQGIQKIEMLKFASTLGAGKVADTDLYSVIKGYKYSSFDVSKFTKQGSPIITKDGIASGFDGNNYIKTSLVGNDIDDFEIHCRVVPRFNSSITTGQYILKSNSSNNISGIIGCYPNKRLFVSFQGDHYGPFVFTDGVTTDIKLKLKNNVLSNYISVDGGNTWTKNFEVENITNTLLLNNLCLGLGFYRWYGSIDLKRFKMFINGEEVFNGRKEGMDILKADDFTVVGTPTISADGITSGFSDSNYVTSSSITLKTTKWDIEGIFNSNDIQLTSNRIIEGTSSLSLIISASSNRLAWSFGTLVATRTTNFVVDNNTNHYFKLSYNNGIFNLYVDGVLTDTFSATIENDITTTIYFGKSPLTANRCLDGSIDLNSFRIYIDDILVYQPLLRIPYTLSSTGLKVTDKLDRAIDMAEQCGFSDYFGLDEDNLLCLVPQGDNITGRRELISRVEDSVTHYVTEIYSDLYCRQMGSGTATTAVTLDIPFKDGNYKLSVPQSAKSKTGFTPTATCDWVAEGYIYLDEVA